MSVRCKFECQSVNKDSGQVILFAVHSGSPENEDFFKWTPSAEVRLQTVNERALEAFKPGQQYYVDFTPTEA